MKKLLVFLFVLIVNIVGCAVAGATPSFYANPRYDLRDLDTIKVVEIISEIPENAKAVAMPEEKVMSALYKGAQKTKIQVVDTRANDVNVGTRAGRLTFANLQVVIGDMSTSRRFVPGYWTTRTDYKERVWYDYNGKKHTDRIPYERQEWVPDSWHVDIRIDVIYNLLDPETGEVIANSSDQRERSDEDNPNGMLGRSATDFFKNIQKAANKNK